MTEAEDNNNEARLPQITAKSVSQILSTCLSPQHNTRIGCEKH